MFPQYSSFFALESSTIFLTIFNDTLHGPLSGASAEALKSCPSPENQVRYLFFGWKDRGLWRRGEEEEGEYTSYAGCDMLVHFSLCLFWSDL